MRLAVAAVAAVLVASVAGGTGAATEASSADVARRALPAGLTAYGSRVWNLEGLLHESFGTRDVYVELNNYRQGPLNFTTTFRGNCCTSYYLFTFRDAWGSSFRRIKLAKRLPATIGASGSEIPVTISGRYIMCGSGRWLYKHQGNGPANFQVDCWKP